MRNKIFNNEPNMKIIFIWNAIGFLLGLVFCLLFWVSLGALIRFCEPIHSPWLIILAPIAFVIIGITVLGLSYGMYLLIRKKCIGKEDTLFDEQSKVLKADWEDAIKINDAYNYVANHKQSKKTLKDNKILLTKVGIKI